MPGPAPYCPKCVATPGAITCPACGRVNWDVAVPSAIALPAVFAVGLLIVVYTGTAWLRVVACAVALACVLGLLGLRACLVRAGVRAGRPPGAPPSLSVQGWTVGAVAALIGLTAAGFALYDSFPSATPTPLVAATPLKYPLRGEAFRNGDVLTVTATTNITNARLGVREPSGTSETTVDSRTVRAQRWTLDAVAGRQPVRMTALLTRAETRNTTTVDGKPVEEVATDPAAGLAGMEFTRTPPSAVWTKALTADARAGLARVPGLLPEVERDAAGAEAWDPRDGLYPAVPSAVGDEWTRSGAELRPLLGVDLLAVEGEARFRVAEFTQFKGLNCARIVVHLSVKGAFRDPLLGRVEFTLTGSGGIVRSVEHGIDLLTRITGTTVQNSEVPDPAGPRRVTLTGPISLEESVAVTRGAGGDPKWNVSDSDLTQLQTFALAKTLGELESAARSALKGPAPGKLPAPKWSPAPKLPAAKPPARPPLGKPSFGRFSALKSLVPGSP